MLGFSQEFRNLVHLKTLDMSGHTGVCNLDIILPPMFTNITSIQYLNVSYCKVKRVDRGVFRVLSNLLELNISHNRYLTFRVLANVTDDLQYTRIDVLDVSRIHCYFGAGTAIYKEDLVGLYNTNLTRLHLDENRVSIFEPNAVDFLPTSLQHLTGNGNRFSFDCYFFWLLLCFPNLRTVEFNNLYPRHDPYAGGRINWEEMNCQDWRAPPRDSSCILSGYHTFPYDQIIIPIPIPQKLENIIVSNSHIATDVGHWKLQKNELRHIEVQNNLIRQLWGFIENINNVVYIDFSNNYCEQISEHFLKDGESLETVIAHHNLLGDTVANDVEGNIFHTSCSIKSIDFSFNRLYNVPKLFLKNQNKLEYINLSNNNLNDFKLDIHHMHSLLLLNLSNNQLSMFDKQTRSQVDMLKGGNLTIDLSLNRFQCSCGSLEFIEWLQTNENMFFNMNDYLCVFANGSENTFVNIHWVQFRLSCQSFISLIAGVSSAIIVAIVIVVLVIAYRYRWKLRYWYYMATQRYRNYRPVNNGEDDEYVYDAFVSYSQHDDIFVNQDIINNLEKDRGLRLCLHQRDFVPGKTIGENITYAVHNSRKTIVILSREYLHSYWCVFEFNMARMESIYTREGRPNLFLVFHGPKPANRDLPLEMIDLIHSDTYDEYPDDEQGNVVFWNRIAAAISP